MDLNHALHGLKILGYHMHRDPKLKRLVRGFFEKAEAYEKFFDEKENEKKLKASRLEFTMITIRVRVISLESRMVIYWRTTGLNLMTPSDLLSFFLMKKNL